MNHRKIIGSFFVLSLVGMLLGYFLIYQDETGICGFVLSGVAKKCDFSIGEPLLISLLPVSSVLFILLFVPKYVYNTWKKFARVYVPLGFLLIVFAPASCGGWFGCFPFDYTKEIAAWIAGGGFAVISFLIIVYQIIKFQLLKKGNHRNESSA